MNGFGLGGAFEGFNQAQQTANQTQQVANTGAYQQGLLKLQAQHEKNQQQRELHAQADKYSSEIMGIVTQTIQNAAITAAQNGQPLDVSKISKAISPLVEKAKNLRTSSGGDSSVLDAMVNAQFANLQSSINPPPKSEPKNLTIAQPTDPSADVGGEKMPPGQNLTGPNSEVTGVTYEDESHTPLPTPGVGYDLKRIQNVLSVLPKDDPRRSVFQEQYREALRIQSERPQLHNVTTVDGTQKLVAVDRNGVQHDVVDNSMDGQQKQRVEEAYKNDVHGDQFLKALPSKDVGYVKGIATYKINPNTSSIRGGRRETVMNWVMQYNPEYDQTVFSSKNRALSTLGQRVGQISGAIENAKATAPRVLETSELVDRTRFTDLNKIIVTADEKLGDPNVVRFKAATLTFINNYARALGAGTATLTDSARQEAMDILKTAYSKGQIKAAISQMMVEMNSELNGTRNALSSTRDVYGETGGSQPQQGSSAPSVAPPPPGFVVTSP